MEIFPVCPNQKEGPGDGQHLPGSRSLQAWGRCWFSVGSVELDKLFGAGCFVNFNVDTVVTISSRRVNSVVSWVGVGSGQ